MRISKKSGSKAKDTFNPEGLTIDNRTLDIFCRYIISDPSYIKLANVINLNNLIRLIPNQIYENDFERQKRIRFIKAGISARIEHGLEDRELILNHIKTNLDFDVDFMNDHDRGFSQEESIWVNHMIEDTEKFGFIYGYMDSFLDICTKIKTTDYNHRGTLVDDFGILIDRVKNEYRRITTDDDKDVEFNLRDGIFERAITEVYKDITNPSRRLTTGMQGLNKMIGGGFECGRTYMFLGITGVGKSVVLLNLAYQIKKHNPKFTARDSTKSPAIVYLTMENTVVETVTRLFDLVTDSQYTMGNYTLDEVITKLRTEGQLSITENNPINLVIKYKPNKSVDTSYLYQLYDDLYDDGLEMICLIQDHLMRIRSIYKNPEPRFELGDIVNEFKVFAAEKHIPVISNFHLNRDAMKAIESTRNSTMDVTQKLGKSNISESVMILNNTDCGIIINRDIDDSNIEYMGFHLIKMRDKTSLMYFAQPFMYANGIRLVEDLGGPTMFKESIHGSNYDNIGISNVRTSSANVMSNINSIVQDDTPISKSFMETNRYDGIKTDDEFNDIPEPEIKVAKTICPIYFIDNTQKQETMDELKDLKATLMAKQDVIEKE